MISYVDVINGLLLKQSNIFVFLNADERTPYQHGCNTERSASASVVENDVSRICVCPDQITTELNRLLGRVVHGALGFGRLKIDDVSWITAAVALYVLRGKSTIASSELMDLKELMRDRESFNHKVFEGSRDDLANLGLELRTFNVQDFSDSQGIIRSMGADQAAEIKKEAELAQIRAEQEVAERQNQLDLKKAELKKTADKAAAEADMVKQTVTAEKQRELYVAQQEAQIAAETKKVELAERQVAVKERELDATVRKQAEADRYAAEQKADAELYTRTKNAEAAKVEAQNKSDADLYSAQKTAEGVSAKAKAEAEATRLKGEADGAAEKAHGEGVAAGIKAQTEAYNGMENAYLLANRYIDVMPEVAEAVAKPLTAVDSIKMYGDGNATKLVRDTTGMVDQVTSGLKDATGIDLTELLSSFHQPFQPREDNE